jgi:hypothetical protein
MGKPENTRFDKINLIWMETGSLQEVSIVGDS